jgi:hypothetical protein
MWLFVLMAAAFLVFQNGVITGYDGGTMYEITKSMVDGGTFAVPAEWNALPGRDGLAHSRYGLGLSVVAALPYALSRPTGDLFAPIVVLLPFALLRLWREDLPVCVLLGGNLAITFVMIATWFAWHGGLCWGPRLLLPGDHPGDRCDRALVVDRDPQTCGRPVLRVWLCRLLPHTDRLDAGATV